MNIGKFLWEENVGGFDLMLRSVAGTIAIIALAMGLAPYPLDWALAAVAFVGLFSGMTRHCTPYAILGISTAEKKKR